MNAALCREVGEGAFPTPQQVLAAGPAQLQACCGVGYRAKTICALAQQVTGIAFALANNMPSPCIPETAILPGESSNPEPSSLPGGFLIFTLCE